MKVSVWWRGLRCGSWMWGGWELGLRVRRSDPKGDPRSRSIGLLVSRSDPKGDPRSRSIGLRDGCT